MANFDSEFFGLVFPVLQATQKIHAQNSRSELPAFLPNFTFLNPKIYSRRFSAYGGDQQFFQNFVLQKLMLGQNVPDIGNFRGCRSIFIGILESSKMIFRQKPVTTALVALLGFAIWVSIIEVALCRTRNCPEKLVNSNNESGTKNATRRPQ